MEALGTGSKSNLVTALKVHVPFFPSVDEDLVSRNGIYRKREGDPLKQQQLFADTE